MFHEEIKQLENTDLAHVQRECDSGMEAISRPYLEATRQLLALHLNRAIEKTISQEVMDIAPVGRLVGPLRGEALKHSIRGSSEPVPRVQLMEKPTMIGKVFPKIIIMGLHKFNSGDILNRENVKTVSATHLRFLAGLNNPRILNQLLPSDYHVEETEFHLWQAHMLPLGANLQTTVYSGDSEPVVDVQRAVVTDYIHSLYQPRQTNVVGNNELIGSDFMATFQEQRRSLEEQPGTVVLPYLVDELYRGHHFQVGERYSFEVARPWVNMLSVNNGSNTNQALVA